MLRASLSPSLRELASTYAVGAAALVVLTLGIGATGLYVWQQSSRDALRVNALVEEAQGMRGALYRQMKEVFDAVFLEDRQAAAQYRSHEAEIRTQLARLEQLAQAPQERDAVRRVVQSYQEIRAHTDGILDNWMSYSLADKRRILDTELEQGSLASYERAFGELERLLNAQGRALQRRLAWLAWGSPLLLMLPVAGAVILLLWSRQWLKRAIVEPLVSVQRATEEISKGDLAHRVPVVGADELRQLGTSVNQMATDLAASRESLVRAEKEAMLAALVPVVAHNIRNPLASIRATAQVMDDGSLPDEVRDGLKGIIASTDRLEHWTHALLSYLNPLEPQRTLCRAATLVENMERMLRPRLTQKQVTIELSQFDRDVELRVDAQLMEQALLGLVQNAIDASPEGSSVHLSLARAGDSIAIAVVDHGSGMPFSPAPRDLKPGPSTKRFGTGLGIPFAMKVFDRHGGSVRFSRAESGGTCVSISLPA